jgi:SAM-dependent methyltransferase
VADQHWNHNDHYHRAIVAAIPAGCERALDIGCGQGALTRRLRAVVPQVTGIDRDERSVELARAHAGAGDIEYLLADFADVPFEPQSVDLITSVASLHHMDPELALRRMADLLRPGGVIAVIGLARIGSPADLYLEPASFVGHRARQIASRLRGAPRTRPGSAGHAASEYASPVIWPPPLTYGQTRELAERVLPGCAFRRRMYWRYSLLWTKPAG